MTPSPSPAESQNQPSRGKVLRSADLPVIDRARGVKTQPLVMHERGSRTLTMGISTFQPNSVIPLHTHNVEEAITILEGEGIAIIDGQEFPVRPHDTTFVPPGVPHHFRNESGGVMRFMWVYGGTDVTRTYAATGETVQHLSAEDIKIATEAAAK
jgi:quercetin dioxygenase-like cupin family protein